MESDKKNSVWLRKLGITMLNAGDTALSAAHRYMAELFGAETTDLILSDPDSNELKSICVRRGYASMRVIEEGTDDGLICLIRKVSETGQRKISDGFAVLPLSCSQAEHFGILVFENGSSEKALRNWNSEKEEAVSSFSETVYSELMGGFMQSGNETVMEVRDVCVRYGQAENIRNTVDHISLDIRKNELTVIMGRSGCGKSSLLNVMAGILTPSSGKVLWHGKNICTMNDEEKTEFRRDTLGYIFQNYNLISELTAAENVAVSAILSHTESLIDTSLDLVELKGKNRCYPRQMSGGEQQRVSIARAIVKKSELLLCDEPTGALDTENAKLVMCLLQRIAKEQKVPVVVVTHNPDYAVLADHYIRLRDGRIEEEFYRHFPYSAERIL